MGRRKRRISAVVSLAPPRISRKQARKITTQFHRLVADQQKSLAVNDADANDDDNGRKTETSSSQSSTALEALRADYQRASQVSTSYFSTSKWVLGYLIQNGWFYGIRVGDNDNETKNVRDALLSKQQQRKRQARERRPTRVLEIGAINTELLDAAAEERTSLSQSSRGANLFVRAIDIHSMHEGRIEEADFLTMPLPNDPFDVVVCSMVLNCVATPEDRGRMLQKIFSCLRPNGILFLTVPKTCLNLSPYINNQDFEDILRAVGFDIQEHTKDSPKIAFFVATRSMERCSPVETKWTKQRKRFRGSKYRNRFSVVLPER